MTTFTERNVYWGISEDDNIWDGKVLFSENLDLTTSSNFYTISQKPKIEQLTTDDISCIFEAGGQTFFCDEDRNLYRLGNSTPVWTSEIVLETWVTSEWLYMIDASEDIHRISLSNLNETNWTTFITTTDTTIPNTAEDIFILPWEDVTYIWVDKNVYRVENTNGTVESANTFTISSPVRWLGEVESRVEIFTEEWKYIIWDWVAGGLVRIKDLWIKIGVVKTVGRNKFIISGGSIYRLNWYDTEQLFYDTYSDVLQTTKYRISSINSWTLSYLEDIFYIGVSWAVNLSSPDNSYLYWDGAILTVGTKKSWFPSARNLFISRVNNVRISNIHFIYTKLQPFNSFWKTLYFWYKDVNGQAWLASIVIWDADQIVSGDGVLVYKTFDWLEKEQIKQLNEIKVRADMPNTDCAIYLCNVVNGQLEWACWTKEDSKRVQGDAWQDGLYSYFIDELKQDFFDFTPALLLEQEWTYLRKDAVKVYSLTYIYNAHNNESR